MSGYVKRPLSRMRGLYDWGGRRAALRSSVLHDLFQFVHRFLKAEFADVDCHW